MPSSATRDEPGSHRLYGGRLCLDFANTVEPRSGPPARDFLSGYPALVSWARHAEALDPAQADRLLAAAEARPPAARASFQAALALREATYRAFAAIARGATPAAADLDAIGQAYAAAMRHARLAPGSERLTWTWEDDALDRAWWPLARSAVDLATEGPLERVKLCGNHPCAWLFLDTSKNRTRRWCSMGDCGSQTKARRQTQRRRAARAS